MDRLELLECWVKTLFPKKSFTLHPASADASFRRYFRLTVDDQTLIVMDAPPQHEDCTSFIQVADILSKAGVHAPEILAKNLAQGFLILSDLGDTTYLQAMNTQPDRAQSLYQDATEA
ncbi:MAG: phosphotransferase, partial [Betaproteobacteria bacterium]|nr:phosphotransferase [Betaproteobacteria bacterium]